jgi:hypothetical protein
MDSPYSERFNGALTECLSILELLTPSSSETGGSNLSEAMAIKYQISNESACRIAWLVRNRALREDDARSLAACIQIGNTRNQDNRQRTLPKRYPEPVPIHSENTEDEAEDAERMAGIMRALKLATP